MQLLLVIVFCTCACFCQADRLRVAVASNFLSTMQVLADGFEEETGHQVQIASASSGKLFVQIRQGAPFDLFFSADQDKIERLVDVGLVVEGSDFNYAQGRLVLLSRHASSETVASETVVSENVVSENIVLEKIVSEKIVTENTLVSFNRIAMANPKFAPYGVAANAVLAHIEKNNKRVKRVYADNVAQVFQFVVTGNVDAGFVALSQVKRAPELNKANILTVPDQWYPQLLQRAGIMTSTRRRALAEAFVEYVRSDAGAKIIENSGYRLPAVVQ